MGADVTILLIFQIWILLCQIDLARRAAHKLKEINQLERDARKLLGEASMERRLVRDTLNKWKVAKIMSDAVNAPKERD